MSDYRLFKAFFSYAHLDADTDPDLITAFTDKLEKRLNAKLANARFAIWRDKEGLRTGDRWNSKIEEEVRAADILIILLTPRWVESDYCRKEYEIFEEIEAGREVGDYVVPILARATEQQEKHFTESQNDVYERIRDRQYQSAIATDFVRLNEGERVALIDKIADDIGGMIERLRALPSVSLRPATRPTVRPRRRREFDSNAQNYERVDFVTDAEVVLDRPTSDGRRNVLANVAFIERLYVEGNKGRIEFGVRRAYLSMTDGGPGRLEKIDEPRGDDHKNGYYVKLRDTPEEAITICMDPPKGKTSLTEVPLPPARGENFLSKVATAAAEARPEQIKAQLVVSLDTEGLYLADGRSISPRTQAAIKAIMQVTNAKLARSNHETIDDNGFFRRSLPVKERS